MVSGGGVCGGEDIEGQRNKAKAKAGASKRSKEDCLLLKRHQRTNLLVMWHGRMAITSSNQLNSYRKRGINVYQWQRTHQKQRDALRQARAGMAASGEKRIMNHGSAENYSA
jgi:hypothetical protein